MADKYQLASWNIYRLSGETVRFVLFATRLLFSQCLLFFLELQKYCPVLPFCAHILVLIILTSYNFKFKNWHVFWCYELSCTHLLGAVQVLCDHIWALSRPPAPLVIESDHFATTMVRVLLLVVVLTHPGAYRWGTAQHLPRFVMLRATASV